MLAQVDPPVVLAAASSVTAAIIYGTAFTGQLWQYDAVQDSLEKWDQRIPCGPGRQSYNKVTTWAYEPARDRLYGASQADGTLFTIDLPTRDIRSLGQVDTFSPVNAMALAADGRLFGIAGGPDDVGRFFAYDPDRHKLRDLGICASVLGARVYGFVFQAASPAPTAPFSSARPTTSATSGSISPLRPAHIPGRPPLPDRPHPFPRPSPTPHNP